METEPRANVRLHPSLAGTTLLTEAPRRHAADTLQFVQSFQPVSKACYGHDVPEGEHAGEMELGEQREAGEGCVTRFKQIIAGAGCLPIL